MREVLIDLKNNHDRDLVHEKMFRSKSKDQLELTIFLIFSLQSWVDLKNTLKKARQPNRNLTQPDPNVG